ncbi:hypothetical protein B0H11DRAFT_1931462 [Mycena galericulata]|nr:hypothetical protein B0H11DRAFT_1931462 [Mycena galericulata]
MPVPYHTWTLRVSWTNRSPGGCSVLLLAHVLEVLDLAQKNEKGELSVGSPTLSKKINSYTRKFSCQGLARARSRHQEWNVAGLVEKLLRGTGVKATALFYLRFAFFVDELIQKYRKEYETEQELDAFYDPIYQKIIVDHGDPTATVYKTTASNPSSNSCQVLVRKHYIRPNPRNPTILGAAYKSKASRRCRLNEDGDNDGSRAGGNAGGNAEEQD